LISSRNPDKSWTHYNYNPDQKGSVTSNSIITIFEDSRQNIWFGTEGAGLCTFDYDTETFASFDPENQVLQKIEWDKDGIPYLGVPLPLSVRLNKPSGL
jgi:GH43 family beta-xylosidase